MTEQPDILRLAQALMHVYNRKWWQFWRPKITEEWMIGMLRKALIGERDPIRIVDGKDLEWPV